MKRLIRAIFILILFTGIPEILNGTEQRNSQGKSNDPPPLISFTEKYFEPDKSTKLPKGKTIFPRNNIWNTPIKSLPVHPQSNAYISAIGSNKHLYPDFGEDWEAGIRGIPYVAVGGNQPKVSITFSQDFESDPGPYPIPSDTPIEGGADSHGKRRIIVIDTDNWLLYELLNSWPQNNGTWYAVCGAVFNLNSNKLRPVGWTSADAAGLPIFPGLVRYDEVESGAINHVLRFFGKKHS